MKSKMRGILAAWQRMYLGRNRAHECPCPLRLADAAVVCCMSHDAVILHDDGTTCTLMFVVLFIPGMVALLCEIDSLEICVEQDEALGEGGVRKGHIARAGEELDVFELRLVVRVARVVAAHVSAAQPGAPHSNERADTWVAALVPIHGVGNHPNLWEGFAIEAMRGDVVVPRTWRLPNTSHIADSANVNDEGISVHWRPGQLTDLWPQIFSKQSAVGQDVAWLSCAYTRGRHGDGDVRNAREDVAKLVTRVARATKGDKPRAGLMLGSGHASTLQALESLNEEEDQVAKAEAGTELGEVHDDILRQVCLRGARLLPGTGCETIAAGVP